MPENNNSNPKRDNLAMLVGFIFVVGLAFAAYTYFNGGNNVQDRIKKNAEKVEDIISSKDDRNDQGTTQDQNKGERLENGKTTNGSAIGTEWIANDYKQGDITGNSYTVKSGDTLWEIAEAVYGDGFQWVKILNANSGSIGFLPNGSQALIFPGQVLTLP
jgi:nucleoid-associated protein YgaU